MRYTIPFFELLVLYPVYMFVKKFKAKIYLLKDWLIKMTTAMIGIIYLSYYYN